MSEVIKGWNGVGKVGDNCPELLMVIPGLVKDHLPVEGKGHFYCLGKKVAQTRSEIIKKDPLTALDVLVGCGYLGCKAKFFQALLCYNEDYPQIPRCENRTTKHDLAWMDHYESPLWSHLNQFLTWLEKQVQKRCRLSPGSFPVCNPDVLRDEPVKEFARLDLIMPFSFLDLVNWAR